MKTQTSGRAEGWWRRHRLRPTALGDQRGRVPAAMS